jgi:CMP-N-acetylneuraminic acid synthetase
MKAKLNIAALIIGRGNNTLRDKNILPVLGRPLLQWPALAAKGSKYITNFFISSDCEKILSVGEDVGFIPIRRPDVLATPTAQSADAVYHAMDEIESYCNPEVIIVMHANVGTITTKMIDDCIDIILSGNDISAVIPSHVKDEYHPYRAKLINKNGYLENVISFGDQAVSANRQDLAPAVFFDHSFWVLSVDKGVKSKNGQFPWPCMGNNIIPYITEGCFDVHTEEDLERTAKWIKENNPNAIF